MSQNGFIIYEGPSQLDGEPIVAIVTGLQSGGRNSKLGKMASIYIIRADMSPMEASHTGADFAICGNCPHRGTVTQREGVHRNVGRTCYVTLFHGPRMVYQGYRNGAYQRATPEIIADAMAGAFVRVGSYGDPAAVPFEVWHAVLGKVASATGYTHQWRAFPELAAFCMASVESSQERDEAKGLGFRTFRVRTADAPTLKGEGKCPASAEMGKAVTCNACMLCSGNAAGKRGDISIIAHGVGARNFQMAA